MRVAAPPILLLAVLVAVCACSPSDSESTNLAFQRLVLRMKDGVAGGSDAFVTPDVKTFLDRHEGDPALLADPALLLNMRDVLLQARSTELIPENLAIVSRWLVPSQGIDAVRAPIEAAAEADGTHFAPPYVLGRLALDQHDPETAVQLFTQACAAAPERPDGYAQLGAALEAAGQLSNALLAYEGSLARAPDAAVAAERDAVKAKLAAQGK